MHIRSTVVQQCSLTHNWSSKKVFWHYNAFFPGWQHLKLHSETKVEMRLAGYNTAQRPQKISKALLHTTADCKPILKVVYYVNTDK